MPSSKGKPTDPQKREEARKEVLQMEKGGGKGQWSAWKASEMAKRYEAKGGDYEDTGDNANQAKKGAPKPKKEAIEKGERKDPSEAVGTPKSAKKGKSDDKKAEDKEQGQDKTEEDDKATPSKRKSDAKDGEKDEDKETTKKPRTKKDPKPAAKGTREQPKRGAKK
uniref:Uncharacterized protein n=1 Tax=Melanopsichium pennsylvanicum 4 TaxID=1398559 RepID=A0A077QUP7_9BASI|nr:conserved hypothetical protein [Melanopsichium pennsylvanicum 4]